VRKDISSSNFIVGESNYQTLMKPWLRMVPSVLPHTDIPFMKVGEEGRFFMS